MPPLVKKVWTPIPKSILNSVSQHYACASTGQIKTDKGLRSPYNNTARGDYPRITVQMYEPDGSTKPHGKLVHRLIAETFLPNPENKPQVNHINGNTSDNQIENLEWVTAEEHERHSNHLRLMRRLSEIVKSDATLLKKMWQIHALLSKKDHKAFDDDDNPPLI